MKRTDAAATGHKFRYNVLEIQKNVDLWLVSGFLYPTLLDGCVERWRSSFIPAGVTGSEECFGFRCFLSQKIGPEGAFDSLIFRIGLLL